MRVFKKFLFCVVLYHQYSYIHCQSYIYQTISWTTLFFSTFFWGNTGTEERQHLEEKRRKEIEKMLEEQLKIAEEEKRREVSELHVVLEKERGERRKEMKTMVEEKGKKFYSLLCPIVFSPFDRTFDT